LFPSVLVFLVGFDVVGVAGAVAALLLFAGPAAPDGDSGAVELPVTISGWCSSSSPIRGGGESSSSDAITVT
jgi:hypothetical protein